MSAAAPTKEEIARLSAEEKRVLLARLLQEARRAPVLSVTQERLWQLDQIAPGNPVYNFQSALAVTGPLDREVLDLALARIVARHETLRTRYDSAQGKPRLEVLPALAVRVAFADMQALPADQHDAALQRAATQAARTGFVLAEPPLLTVQCLRFAPERHALVLTMHHIVSDLLSLDLFFEELGQHYGTLLADRGAALQPLAWTYQDHARAEHAARVALRQGPAAAFWRAHLAHAPELAWRSDFPRPARPGGQAATTHFRLEAATVKAVEALAVRERVTPFMVLLAAWYLLQSAASGQADQLVGVPGAGRGREDLQGLIGMFSSPLPMRLDMDGLADSGALLQAVKRTVLGVTEHAALPLADIVEQAQAGNDGRAPQLRSMFSFVSRMKTLALPGMVVERVPTDRGMSDFDLFLTLYQDGAAWRGVFEYATELFGAGTAQAWAEAYAAIVETLAAGPARPLAELRARVPVPRPLRIAVAATFTADGLEDIGRFWQSQLRWPVEMTFAPYNQVFQTLADPAGDFLDEANALAVLLVRPEDWVRYLDDADARARTLASAADEFIGLVRQARPRAPLAVYLCPRTSGAAAIVEAERHIEQALAGLPGVTVLRAETALAGHALGDVHDAQADDIGHIPFARPWFIAMGTELVRRASGGRRAPCKVIALDCDNTLWRGVCGEDGALGVRVDAPFLALQEFVARQAAEGVLLCLVSKNEPEDVFRVFEANPGMRLRRDQVVAHRINWLPKSENLRSLAAELKLGLDSFVFLDDNPVECAEVRAACPDVLALCLPTDLDTLPAVLRGVWAFDRHQVTDADRQRAASYLQNRQRDALRQSQGSFQDFLDKLALKVEAVPADPDSQPRLAQLSQRTNQFNNSGLRFDEGALARALDDGLHMLAVSVGDRFGDYGLVGAAGHRVAGTALRVETFMLSCRVLGRGVEHVLLAQLGRAALALGLGEVRIVFKELPRNQPFRRFLAGLDGAFDADGGHYVLPASVAAAARFDPARHGTDGVEEPGEPAAAASPASDVLVARQAALAEIATRFTSIDAIAAELDRNAPRRRAAAGGAPPQGDTEKAIAEVWQALLHVDGLGRDDNFFEVGGNSLLLVQVNSRLIDHFRRDIQITSLFQFPTIASLARHLGNGGNVAEQRAQVQARGEQARKQMQQRMAQLGSARARR